MFGIASFPRWTTEIVRTVLILAIVLAVGNVYQARGDNHETVWYACLYGGSLSQVSTNPPANCGRGTEISWGGATDSSGITGLTTVTTVATQEFDANGWPQSILLYCPNGLVPIGSGYSLEGVTFEIYYMGAFNYSVTTDRAVARDAGNPYGFPSELFSPSTNVTFDPAFEYGWEFIVEDAGFDQAQTYTFHVYCAAAEAAVPL